MSPGTSNPLRPAYSRAATIKTHLIALLAFQAVLLAGLIGYSAVHDYHASQRHAVTAADADSKLAARTIERAVFTNLEQLQSEAAIPGYESIFVAPQSCTLAGNNDDFFGSDVSIVRPDGSVACTSLRPSGGLPGAGYGSIPAFMKAMGSGKAFNFGPVVDPTSKQYAFVQAAPLKMGGALVTSFRLDKTGHGLDQRLGLRDPTPSFIVTTADRSAVITSSSPLASRSLRGTGLGVPLPKRGTPVGDRIYSDTTVQGVGWHVLAGVSSKEAFADATRSLRDRGALGFIMMIVVFAAGLIIQRRIVRPVRSLWRATLSAAEGDLDVRTEPYGPREIADLTNGFNFMLSMRGYAEEKLREAYTTERDASDRLRELDDLKNSFLMAISHELRTPLTAVMGYATLLKQELPEASLETATDYANRIEISAQRLSKLMLDLLDFERMSRGIIEPQRQPTNMRRLVDRVLSHIELDRNIKVDIPVTLEAEVDAALLERVVENLVINAVKHTPQKASIWVRAYRRQNKVLLAVEDSGRGVPRKLRTEIFEPFKQGDVPAHSPGTGVGLALVSQFAKLHGGKAWVEDRTGGGASFRVALPPVLKKSKRDDAGELDLVAS